jgi:hypothetical protein
MLLLLFKKIVTYQHLVLFVKHNVTNLELFKMLNLFNVLKVFTNPVI